LLLRHLITGVDRPTKIPSDIRNGIIEHVKGFPVSESKGVRYLPPDLNVSKMYRLYLENFKADEKPPSLPYYSNIFKTKFNLSFGIPRSDAVVDVEEHGESP